MSWRMTLLLLAPLGACATAAKSAAEQGQALQHDLVQVVDVEYTDATVLVHALQSTLTENEEGGLRVAADPRSNRILLSGSADAVERAVGVIERLDRPQTEHVAVLRLENIHAQELASVLTMLLQERTVMAYGQHHLLATGTEEELARMRELVAELDRTAGEDS
ncbi:MAG: hypothetical protein EYC70_15150 [Planctomycetota bacterium]|nr:MAG: hypothetical protein EYC70_15150 [Planctomycetota bacterium]